MSDSWEAVALRCFRLEEQRRRERKKAQRRESASKRTDSGTTVTKVGCARALAKFAGLWLCLGLVLGQGVLGLLSAVGILVLVRFLPPWLRVSRRLNAYRAGKPEVVLDVYRFAAGEFRGEIARHRTRTLGSESEWAAAREVLAQATDDADRSVAYWRNRGREDPDDQVIARQLNKATELDEKLRSALGKLDGRADVLRRFFNECEAKVSGMDRYNRDLEEIRRLDRLSGTADMAIAGAEATLAGIGASFVRQARKVRKVFEDFERLQLEALAGEVPLDDIELLADRINEASEWKYATVEELSRTMGGSAEPTGR